MILQESLGAVFRWYRDSPLPIVFLRGVGMFAKPGDLQRSISTARKYLASKAIQFYTVDWTISELDVFNQKRSIDRLRDGGRVQAFKLAHTSPGLRQMIRQKPYLTSTRESTLVEDAVHPLLGMSSVQLTVIRGKGGQGNDNLASIPQLVRLNPPKRQLTPPQQTDSTPTHLLRLQLPLGIWPLTTHRHRLRIVQLIQPPQ